MDHKSSKPLKPQIDIALSHELKWTSHERLNPKMRSDIIEAIKDLTKAIKRHFGGPLDHIKLF